MKTLTIGAKVIYGKVKLLPKTETAEVSVTPVAAIGEVININGKNYKRID